MKLDALLEQLKLTHLSLQLDAILEQAAKRDLGYKPLVEFEEGMRRLCEWLRK